MFSYTAYGLCIRSEIELPELIPSDDTAPDVAIRNGNLEIPSDWRSLDYAFNASSSGMLMYWRGVGSILVKCGKEIVVDTDSEPDVPRLRLFLLGAAMGTILHQKGLPVFHASAVAIDGNAVLFVGDKGWGKSTMAAHLHRKGHEILSDDVVALRPEDGGFAVLSAFPQLKLWPDALESLGEDPERLPLISSLFDKRHRSLDTGFGLAPRPLKSVYLLDSGPRIEIAPVGGQQAMVQLIRNLYVARFGRHLLKPGDTKYFYQCSEIVNKIPIYALRRPSSLDLMEDIAGMVESHVSGNLERTVCVKAA